MATFNELLGRLGNEDISSWLQLRACWSQPAVVLTRTPCSDVITPAAGVAMTTVRDLMAAAEKDNRLLSMTLGKC